MESLWLFFYVVFVHWDLMVSLLQIYLAEDHVACQPLRGVEHVQQRASVRDCVQIQQPKVTARSPGAIWFSHHMKLR